MRSGFQYDGPVRRAIQRFKYHGEFQRGYDLGHRLADRVLEARLLPWTQIDAIVPVPLHVRRFRSRGFNQSAILAQCIAEALEIPVLDAVERSRNTSPQVSLTADQRLENLHDAFSVDTLSAGRIAGQSLLVIDDVMTTGATISALAGTLELAGSGDLYGLTLAGDQ